VHAALWSDPSLVPELGSGDCQSGRARRARTRRSDRTCLPRHGTCPGQLRPCSDAAPAPSRRRRGAARPTRRLAARSRPGQPPSSPASGTTPTARPRRGQTSPPTTSRRSRRRRARRASQSPSQSRHTDIPSRASSDRSPSQRPDQEVPLRILIDKALNRGYVLLPLAAPHHRWDGLVYGKPSAKGKESRPCSSGGRGSTRMSYEESSAPRPSRSRKQSSRGARFLSALRGSANCRARCSTRNRAGLSRLAVERFARERPAPGLLNHA